MYKKLLKILINFILALFGLVFFSPIIISFAILIAISNKGNPVFIQKRPGKNKRIFSIIKFKTMNDAKDEDGNLLPDDKRLTGIGKFVRKSSIDELPQLLNVLKGDMSLVGPRPLLIEYLPLYSPEQNRRHEVRPGVTGWAQVNGRNALSWEDKFKLDVWYVDNQSLWLDVKIVFMTVKKVLMRDGIAADGHVTAEKFRGSSQ